MESNNGTLVMDINPTEEGGVALVNNAAASRKLVAKNKKLVKKWEKTGIEQSAMLTPKIDDDNWAIVKNSIFGLPMVAPFSCGNTINSHCAPYSQVVSNVEECKEICKKDEHCEFGEFITIGNKNYCLPFSSLWMKRPGTNGTALVNNAIWNLRSNYQNKHIESSTFYNYGLYSPFQKFDYSLFYGDELCIQPISSKKDSALYLGQSDDTVNLSPSETIIQLIDPYVNESGVIGIENWDNLAINIAGTYLVLQAIDCKNFAKYTACKNRDKKSNDDNFVIWYNGLGAIQNSTSSAKIICFEKKQREILTYDDEVVFILNFQYICTDGEKIFIKTADDINKYNAEPSNKTKLSYKFKLLPRFNVSYCNNTIKPLRTNNDRDIHSNQTWGKKQYCKMINISQCTRTDDNFYYIDDSKNKHIIYRGTWCGGRCKDDGAVQATNQVPFITKSYTKNIIIDQLIISISITVLSFILCIILAR